MSKILIIDDAPEVRDMIEQILQRKGYETLSAKNGKEGISLYETHDVGVVITDLIMPEKEGVETIRELKRKHGDKVKIIAISGGGRVNAHNYLKTAKIFGANEVFSKPFDRKRLLAEVERLLSID